MTAPGRNGAYRTARRSRRDRRSHRSPAMAMLDDVITYLEMHERPKTPRLPAPAGYFELDAAPASETELCYFGLIPEFIGRGFGPFLLQAAIDRAWERPIGRLWVHTRTFDHPKALGHYQRAGFVVYARRELRFEDPRLLGYLPRSLKHPRLPPLDQA